MLSLSSSLLLLPAPALSLSLSLSLLVSFNAAVAVMSANTTIIVIVVIVVIVIVVIAVASAPCSSSSSSSSSSRVGGWQRPLGVKVVVEVDLVELGRQGAAGHGSQVDEPGRLLDGERPRHAQHVHPLRQLVHGEQRHDGARRRHGARRRVLRRPRPHDEVPRQRDLPW